ncbi:MAG: hypothetical protein GKR89_17710 [Candidatus Latescibacteria bacterium]|nr:hypothetical protein [Candidatus Latescibacterota bacterium]
MVFSSQLFLFYFLPLSLALYYATPQRLRPLVLTLLSYTFYGWANPLFLALIFASTTIDYFCALTAARPGRYRRWALFASIAANLSLLGFFKYANFAAANYDALLQALGLPAWQLDLGLRIALPLGISFYTFQSMSYTIDVYRGRVQPLRNFIDFACYISLFPQLVAGPIVRYVEIADQLLQRSHTLGKFARGAALVSLGLGKKVLLANPCGKIADTAFNAGSIGPLDAWLGALAYAFQIYFDFSGYSDMAIGLGLMLGFVLPKNFDAPYRAESITQFWQRWHLSLSYWLRDYLYIPLGGNRKGAARTYLNLAVVMLLGGLWHGAAWNFLAWGGLHGALLGLERARGRHSLYAILPRPARVGCTFVILLFTWVFFRAADLPSALHYCASMLALTPIQEGAGLIGGLLYQPYYLATLAAAALVVWAGVPAADWTRHLSAAKVGLVLLVLWPALAALLVQDYNPFIYFIF